MTDELTGEWIECVVDKDYEINTNYPYPIRRKGTDKIVKETIQDDGYVHCSLNYKRYMKHRLIAFQWMPNDESEAKPVIDHINHQRADNRLTNLRWVSVSDNNKNKVGWRDDKFNFFDELPETAEPLDRYNNHELNGIYVDYENRKVYKFIDVGYRELIPRHANGLVYYHVIDLSNKYTRLYYNRLFD